MTVQTELASRSIDARVYTPSWSVYEMYGSYLRDRIATSLYYEMHGMGGDDIFIVGGSENYIRETYYSSMGPFTAGFKIYDGGTGYDTIKVSVPFGGYL